MIDLAEKLSMHGFQKCPVDLDLSSFPLLLPK